MQEKLEKIYFWWKPSHLPLFRVSKKSLKSFLCWWCFTVNYQFRTRSVLFTEIRPQWQFQFHVTFHCHWCAVSFWTYVLPNWSYSPQLNCLLQRCQYSNLHFKRPKIARYVIFFLHLQSAVTTLEDSLLFNRNKLFWGEHKVITPKQQFLGILLCFFYVQYSREF